MAAVEDAGAGSDCRGAVALAQGYFRRNSSGFAKPNRESAGNLSLESRRAALFVRAETSGRYRHELKSRISKSAQQVLLAIST